METKRIPKNSQLEKKKKKKMNHKLPTWYKAKTELVLREINTILQNTKKKINLHIYGLTKSELQRAMAYIIQTDQ